MTSSPPVLRHFTWDTMWTLKYCISKKAQHWRDHYCKDSTGPMSIRLYFPHPDHGVRVPFSSNKMFQYQEGRTVCERGGYDFWELDPGTSGYRLEFPAEYEKWIQDPTTKTWNRDPDSFV